MYKNVFHAIKRNKSEIYSSALIFLGTILIGFTISKVYDPVYINKLKIQDFNAMSIIKNNLKACGFLVIGNLFLGLPTIILLFYNGFLDGMLLEIHSRNLDIYTMLSKTIFHGMFELPAIILSGAIGLKTLFFFIRLMNGKKSEIKVDLKDSVILIMISFILILVAGAIEGSILPLL